MKNKVVELFDKHLGMGEAEILLLFIPGVLALGLILIGHFCQ